ncbi:MAG: bifunctional phosphoribosyl-AMP cyclohydrolase/phosphoribosyl-ATP diphosphatase HisIE [Lachnospiraceae bacterium]|nr:bifunctional phosphoribosyl-AMP cyclohydrolase/phosphoribosyl-ATP diphosphatase HisIE [Lachnospiraceae bacterium]
MALSDEKKYLVPCIYLKNGVLVSGFKSDDTVSSAPVEYVVSLANHGADMLLVFDLSEGDSEHDIHLGLIREMTRNIDIPVIGAGNIKRSEDVKKLKYAGCRYVALNMAKQSNIDLIEEVGKRFSRDSIMVCVDVEEEILSNAELIRKYVSGVVLLSDRVLESYKDFKIICVINEDEVPGLLSNQCVSGISGDYVNQRATSLRELKKELSDRGFNMNIYRHKLSFEDLKTDDKGLVPVVVQDVETGQVLMVAYMNREAYEKTEETGIMTYFSRSRQSLWVKGETSGHYQYVKELYADCDLDTILARVKQIGVACHTGNYSCFFNEIVKKEHQSKNPSKVFSDVFSVILDRRENPKDGSYTNYLFDKGIDKILKKVGEEATEIVIAAKNPDKEEVKYEMADFLYHMMVLMAECGLDWSDITEELSKR